MTKQEIEQKIKDELSDWTELWNAVGESEFDVDKFIAGEYIVHNDDTTEMLGYILNSDGNYSFAQVKGIKNSLTPDDDDDNDAPPPPETLTGFDRSYYQGDEYDSNRNIAWIDPDTKKVTEPQGFTSHFDADYLTRIFANDNTQLIVNYQDKLVEAGLMTDDEQAQELGYWGAKSKAAFVTLLQFIDNNMDYATNSPKYEKLKEDIKTSFGDSSFVPDPLGVDFYSGFHKEKDELIPEDILDVMAIREVLNIGLNKAIESQEILERQVEEEFEKTVRLENPELNEFQLTDALNAWAESEGHGKLTQRQLARAFGAYAESYDPYIQSLVDQNNAIRNDTYLSTNWPETVIRDYEESGVAPKASLKDFFYTEDPMTAAVESIEGEKEQESDLISQAKEIENQKIRLLNFTLGR